MNAEVITFMIICVYLHCIWNELFWMFKRNSSCACENTFDSVFYDDFGRYFGEWVCFGLLRGCQWRVLLCLAEEVIYRSSLRGRLASWVVNIFLWFSVINYIDGQRAPSEGFLTAARLSLIIIASSSRRCSRLFYQSSTYDFHHEITTFISTIKTVQSLSKNPRFIVTCPPHFVWL